MTRQGQAGIVLLGAIITLAVVGPMLATDPNVQPDLLRGTLLPPSTTNWLGTDQYSRDVLARLAWGARTSLIVAMIAVSVATTIGIAIGLAAGRPDGWVAALLRRAIDVTLAVPRVLVLLILLAALGTLPIPVFALLLGLVGWAGIARLVRGESLRLRNAQYVVASRALGATPARVLWREILPGTLGAVQVAATLSLADVILLEAGLSFLGMGVRPPAPSWGGMLIESQPYLGSAPWLIMPPIVALIAATSAATLIGASLRQSTPVSR